MVNKLVINNDEERSKIRTFELASFQIYLEVELVQSGIRLTSRVTYNFDFD
jgi:hypothetical protein